MSAIVHNLGLPVTAEWEDGHAAGMQDAADGALNFRPYRNAGDDWQRGYNDAYDTMSPRRTCPGGFDYAGHVCDAECAS
jgi:hypothetical protein